MNLVLGLLLAAPTAAAQPAPAPLAELGVEIDRMAQAEQGEALAAEQLPPPVPDPISPDILGSVAVPVRQTWLDERWHHVSQPDASAGLTRLITPARALGKLEQAMFIQAAVNRKIAYREDIDNWGESDHWATADETLARGAGDCEDFAIIKMQALLELGFDARDLYLVIGEDKAHKTHAILLTRINERFWVLDDRIGRLIEAEKTMNFTPTITLGAGLSWLHGTRTASQQSIISR